MAADRPGITLIETLVALVLVAMVASWSLGAAAAAERALGLSLLRRAALHRAARALADVEAAPCDSLAGATTKDESRWRVAAKRVTAGNVQSHVVLLKTVRGDSIALGRSRWCAS